MANCPQEGAVPFLEAFMGKVIIVTGACGAVGLEICRKLLPSRPFKLFMVDQRPEPLWDSSRILMIGNSETIIEPRLANVTDINAVEQLFEEHQPTAIFHAAALNIVPIMEENPFSSVQTNVFGTKAFAEAAVRHDADLFVLVSTLGAARPRNILDMTKRLAEMYLHTVARESAMRYVSLRLPRGLDEAEKSAVLGDAVTLLLWRITGAGVGGTGASASMEDEPDTGTAEGDSSKRGYVTQLPDVLVPAAEDLTRRLRILESLIRRGDESRLLRLLAQLTSR